MSQSRLLAHLAAEEIKMLLNKNLARYICLLLALILTERSYAGKNHEDYIQPSVFAEEFSNAFDNEDFEHADFMILRFPDTSIFYADPPPQLSFSAEKSSYIAKILKERDHLKNDTKLKLHLLGRWTHKSDKLEIQYSSNDIGTIYYLGETYPIKWRIRNGVLITTAQGTTTAERVMSISRKRYSYIERRNSGLVFMYKKRLSLSDVAEEKRTKSQARDAQPGN